MQTYYHTTPIGIIRITGDGKSITALSLVKKSGKSDTLESYMRKCITELDVYFTGKKKVFTTKYLYAGTPFQQRVWQVIASIPYGETLTYSELARLVGNPRAVRAVGTACGKNPIPIIIPCHRVVPSTGGVGQYAWGSTVKQKLLELEG